MTKVSLKQLRSNENTLNQRSEDRSNFIAGVSNQNGINALNQKSDGDTI